MASEKKAKKSKSKEFLDNQGRFAKLSPDKRSEIAAKGGKARAEKIAAQKSLGQIAKMMMSSSIKDTDIKKILDTVPDLENDDMTVGALVVYGQILAAANGNPKAFEQLLALESSVDKTSSEEDKLTQALKEVGKYL